MFLPSTVLNPLYWDCNPLCPTVGFKTSHPLYPQLTRYRPFRKDPIIVLLIWSKTPFLLFLPVLRYLYPKNFCQNPINLNYVVSHIIPSVSTSIFKPSSGRYFLMYPVGLLDPDLGHSFPVHDFPKSVPIRYSVTYLVSLLRPS